MWRHIQDLIWQKKPQITCILGSNLDVWVQIRYHSYLTKFLPIFEIIRIYPKRVLVPQVELRLLHAIINCQLYFLSVKLVIRISLINPTLELVMDCD